VGESALDNKAVLFVDDEEHILKSLKRLLRKEPYQVFTAVGGEAGLEVLEENPDIQMVVSDQRMPGMCGTEFLAKVKAKYPETIRLVLSGFAEASAIVDAINEGEVFRFIAKPWTDEDLKSTFRQCLEHYDVVQENKRLQKQSERQVEQLKNLNALLEGNVEERTRSLSFSQEVLDTLPLIVLGISQEEEVVLTNGTARKKIPTLETMIPGTEMDEILPESAVEVIRNHLESLNQDSFEFDWNDLHLKGRTSPLGSEEAPRGCVLLLEEA
jgi:response regulator RpfG family c-di-GMP phosphodiesterase